ncbi:MAG: hypothetical protein QW065_02600, partial [Acidilobaceae archaeon]
KMYLFFDEYNGDLRVMPAYISKFRMAGVKVVNVHPNNPKRGLLTVMATILLVDPESGAPLAVMDGTLITAYRTGAGGAIAIKYLARRGSRVLGVIGAGVQGHIQTLFSSRVMKLERVKVYDVVYSKAESYKKEIEKTLGVDVVICESAECAVRGVDVLVTATPAKGPVVKAEWIEQGLHINAIGADAPGKQELDPAILKRAKIVVDDIEQASHSGEINVPLSQGVISLKDIYAELGEIVAGKKPGRIAEDEITVFDSTGLAIQDVATAQLVYRKALKEGLGIMMDFVKMTA